MLSLLNLEIYEGERKKMKIEELAIQCRIDILNMTAEKKAGFVGSAFSCVDVLAVLYQSFIKYTGNEEKDDMLILSKGHAASAWYAVLANVGIIDRNKLQEYNTSGKNLGVHPKRNSLPCIRTTTGSLGQGLGLGCGCALADKISGKDNKTYVILGDGECNEGSVWESFMFGAKQRLNNLIVIIDRNRLQSYGTDEEVLDLDDIAAKCREFHWNVFSIDGHDYSQIADALQKAGQAKERPSVIVANTIKGKGVAEFENGIIWHYKWPEGEIYKRALEELKA